MNSRRSNELLPSREFIARLFDQRGRDLQHGFSGPGRETLTGDAATLENALFFRAQLLDLRVEHLLKRLRNTRVDVLNRRSESPCPPILGNQTLFDDVPHNRHHEQSVSTGVVMNEIRK